MNVEAAPVIFFWGDKSEKDLAFVKSQLDVSKAISSTGAYIARRGTFSKAVVKSFINGYKFQYDQKYQTRGLKRKSKKAEL